jgi:hypothetical protein
MVRVSILNLETKKEKEKKYGKTFEDMNRLNDKIYKAIKKV